MKPIKDRKQIDHYDEASSGSDDNDSSDDEASQDEMMNNTIDPDIIPSSDESDIDGDDNDNDNDSDDSNSDSKTSVGHLENEAESHSKSNYSVSYSSEDDNNDGSDEDLPLHERLQKKENGGRHMRKYRERKSQALEEASKRLEIFKQAQRKSNKKRKVVVDDDNIDDNIKTQSNSKSTTITATRKKKKNKHKPTEVSSKRADFFARGARRLNESGLGVDIGAHRYKPLDPRASNLSGHFDEDNFQHNYSFLEEMRNKEIGQVRKRIAAHKATGNKGNRLRRKNQITHNGIQSSTLEEDEARLKYLAETRANLERRKIERAAKLSVKRKIRDDVESGRGVYFLKRKEKKRLELEAKFEEIQKRGGSKAVEKVLEKKRQKNKSRDAGIFAR